MITLQCAFDIRETVLVPLKIAPVEALHPEAVKMKDTERNAAVDHSIDKGARRLLIIICRKGGGQPQTKRPCRRKCRKPGQRCIVL